MTGITLTADQIRQAPAPVRQWIEQEVITSLGLASRPTTPPAAASPQVAHLVACSTEEAAELLKQIQGVLPAVKIFFEFGRPGIVYGQPGVMALRLLDILHHTQLEDVGQVMACLEIINQALTVIKGDPSARFCGFDNEGHCLIAPRTQSSIATLWQSMIAKQPPIQPEEAAPAVAQAG